MADGAPSPPDPRLRHELRSMLAARAAKTDTESDSYERTARAVRRSRRWRALAALACAGLLLALTVPAAVFWAPPDRPVVEWPVRGSLAGEEAFRQAALSQASECAPDAPALPGAAPARLGAVRAKPDMGSPQLLYAGDNGTLRVAVIAVPAKREAPGSFAFLLWGVSRAAGHPLTCGARSYLPPGQPLHLSWLNGLRDNCFLFAMGPPDTETIGYSTRVRFHPDGTWDRSWRRLSGRSGIAFVELAQCRPMVDQVRFRHEGAWRAEPHSTARGPAAVRSSGGGREAWFPELPGAIAFPLYTSTGITSEDIRAGELRWRFVWHGSGSQPSQLVAVTLPSGATFQVLTASRGDAFRHYVRLVPRGQGSLPVAARIPGSSSILAVVPQAGRGRVQVRSGGESLATVPLDSRGYAALSVRAAGDDAPLTFRVFDSEGRRVYQGPVWREAAPPWNRSGKP